MIRHKSQGSNRQGNRDETMKQNRASAKNRRLAEQMSRRSGLSNSALSNSAVMDKEDSKEQKKGGSVKNRIDRSHMKSDVKDRLGVQNSSRGGRGAGSIQNRLGTIRQARGRPASTARGSIRGRSPSKRGSFRMQSTTRGGRGGRGTQSSRGGQAGRNFTRPGSVRGTGGRGRGKGRGRGRGGTGRRGNFNRENLDSELDNYMAENKV